MTQTPGNENSFSKFFHHSSNHFSFSQSTLQNIAFPQHFHKALSQSACPNRFSKSLVAIANKMIVISICMFSWRLQRPVIETTFIQQKQKQNTKHKEHHTKNFGITQKHTKTLLGHNTKKMNTNFSNFSAQLTRDETNHRSVMTQTTGNESSFFKFVHLFFKITSKITFRKSLFQIHFSTIIFSSKPRFSLFLTFFGKHFSQKLHFSPKHFFSVCFSKIRFSKIRFFHKLRLQNLLYTSFFLNLFFQIRFFFHVHFFFSKSTLFFPSPLFLFSKSTLSFSKSTFLSFSKSTLLFSSPPFFVSNIFFFPVHLFFFFGPPFFFQHLFFFKDPLFQGSTNSKITFFFFPRSHHFSKDHFFQDDIITFFQDHFCVRSTFISS